MDEILKKLHKKEELTDVEIDELMSSDNKYKYNNTKFLRYRNFNKYNYINYLLLGFDYKEIDPLIQELIVNLNVAGLHTRYSCSGHVDKMEMAGYIFFEPTVSYVELYKLFTKLNSVLLNYSKLNNDQLTDRSFYHPDIKIELVPILDEGGTLCTHILRWNCAERYTGSKFIIDKTKVVSNDIFLELFNKVVISNLLIDAPSVTFEGFNNNIVRYTVCGKRVSCEEYEIAHSEFEQVMKEII